MPREDRFVKVGPLLQVRTHRVLRLTSGRARRYGDAVAGRRDVEQVDVGGAAMTDAISDRKPSPGPKLTHPRSRRCLSNFTPAGASWTRRISTAAALQSVSISSRV
jgi:hypothetical protein